MKKILRVRFRIDFDQLCSIGPGKIQLLESIAASGSLSQAARDMEMSYRRAWLLMDSMNGSFDEPVVSANVGGSGGGGAVLTAFGQRLIDTYRTLEKELTTVAKRHLHDIEGHVHITRAKKSKLIAAKERRGLADSKSKQVKPQRRSVAG